MGNNKRSKRYLFTITMLAVFLLCGCDRKNNNVDSKDSKDSIATGTDLDANIKESGIDAETIEWDELVQIGDYTINLQASFEDKSNTTYPVVKCRKRVFTAEEKKNYLEKLSEGTEIYYGGDDYYSKDYWKRMLDLEQNENESFLNTGGQYSEAELEEYNARIQYYTTRYEKAEEDYTIAENFDGDDYVIIKYDTPYKITFTNRYSWNEEVETDGYDKSPAILMEPLFYGDLLPDCFQRKERYGYFFYAIGSGEYSPDNLDNQYKLDKSLIEKYAYDYIDNLGLNNFKIYNIRDIVWTEHYGLGNDSQLGYNGYEVTFYKCYNDEFVLRSEMQKGERYVTQDDEMTVFYEEYEYGPENITLYFDNRGGIQFRYYNPTMDDEVVSDSTSILSADALKSALLSDISDFVQSDKENTVSFERVKFGYVRLVNPDDSEEFTAVPAYLFYTADISLFNPLAINAIDGSRIEINQLYID